MGVFFLPRLGKVGVWLPALCARSPPRPCSVVAIKLGKPRCQPKPPVWHHAYRVGTPIDLGTAFSKKGDCETAAKALRGVSGVSWHSGTRQCNAWPGTSLFTDLEQETQGQGPTSYCELQHGRRHEPRATPRARVHPRPTKPPWCLRRAALGPSRAAPHETPFGIPRTSDDDPGGAWRWHARFLHANADGCWCRARAACARPFLFPCIHCVTPFCRAIAPTPRHVQESGRNQFQSRNSVLCRAGLRLGTMRDGITLRVFQDRA